MITETSTSPDTEHRDEPSDSTTRTLIGRITRLEMAAAALIAAVMLVLVVIEPNILEVPFENERTLLVTFGGTALAALAFVAPPDVRLPDAPVTSSDQTVEDVPDQEQPPRAAEPTEQEPPPPPPNGPVLLGAGRFVGLAGHSGTGDAGIFQNPTGR